MEDLISDIVNSLISEDGKLENSLLKTKVLAYKIKNEALATWVNNELNGYKNDSDLPDYRKFTGRIIGSMSNGYQRITNNLIPINHLDRELIDGLTKFNFKDGIGSIEHLASGKSSRSIGIAIPPEICAIINNNIPTNGYVVEYAQKEISIQSLQGILSTVKSKLLQFILELENNFNIKLNTDDMKDKKEKVNDLIRTTIYGNNNVIITGDKNKQKVSFNIKQNDIKDLLNYLEKEGIEKADLEELQGIVLSEKPNYETKSFGPKVKEWIKKITGKAVDGVWQVSLSSAGQILGTALSQYYGI